MPDSIDLHIKSIQPKLQLLLKKFALLGKENLQIKNENENYKKIFNLITQEHPICIHI